MGALLYSVAGVFAALACGVAVLLARSGRGDSAAVPRLCAAEAAAQRARVDELSRVVAELRRRLADAGADPACAARLAAGNATAGGAPAAAGGGTGAAAPSAPAAPEAEAWVEASVWPRLRELNREVAPTKFHVSAGKRDHRTTEAPHFDYMRAYASTLSTRRQTPGRLLEIGLGCEPGNAGRSLEFWRRYMPGWEVYGLDWDDLTEKCMRWWRDVVVQRGYNTTPSGSAYYAGQWDDPPPRRRRVFFGDQGKPSTLLRAEKAAGPFDVVIDDGSHRSDHMINTFNALFPKLRPGGVYFIEDLEGNFLRHTGPWENVAGGLTMLDFLGNLTQDLSFPYFNNIMAMQRANHKQNTHALWVDSVQCWRYICVVLKRKSAFFPGKEFISRRFGKESHGRTKTTNAKKQLKMGSLWPCRRCCSDSGKSKGLCWCC